MYTSFNDYLEKKHPEYFEEGFGTWVGQKVDQGAKGLGRLGNAAISGLGRGVISGVKRAGETLKHGGNPFTQSGREINRQLADRSNVQQSVGGNEIQQKMISATQKAILLNDPEKFLRTAYGVYKKMGGDREIMYKRRTPYSGSPVRDPYSVRKTNPYSGSEEASPEELADLSDYLARKTFN